LLGSAKAWLKFGLNSGKSKERQRGLYASVVKAFLEGRVCGLAGVCCGCHSASQSVWVDSSPGCLRSIHCANFCRFFLVKHKIRRSDLILAFYIPKPRSLSIVALFLHQFCSTESHFGAGPKRFHSYDDEKKLGSDKNINQQTASQMYHC